MNLLRVFSSRAVIQQAKFQKELDIWRLYHLLYYFEQSHGQDVKVPRPEHKPYRKQYQLVHEGVNKQVRIFFFFLLYSNFDVGDKPSGHSANETIFFIPR